MQRYCVGFLFNEDAQYVALIQKTKPAWQKGRLNGIGGKVEEGESYHDAMVREFREETGVTIPEWTHFCTLTGQDAGFEIQFFTAKSEDVWHVRTTTEEVVFVEEVCCIGRDGNYKLIPNIKWLIPLALNETTAWPVLAKDRRAA